MGTFIYDIGKFQLVPIDAIYMPAPTSGALASIGSGKVMGIPAAALLLAVFSGAVSLLLTRTKVGRFFYAIGDNQQASRIAGIPVGPTLMLQYLISGFVAVATKSAANKRKRGPKAEYLGQCHRLTEREERGK